MACGPVLSKAPLGNAFHLDLQSGHVDLHNGYVDFVEWPCQHWVLAPKLGLVKPA
jgi:hypothetical protein